MKEERLQSKFAFILHADIAGSTALVQQDEELAHRRIQDAFRRFGEFISTHRGHVREIRGDALLAEFERASDAVTAALAFQADQLESGARAHDGCSPKVRVGIAMGEVVVADGTLTGAGVVLAQRIEQLCEPGSIRITGAVHEALPQRMPFQREDLGEHELKGFGERIRVWAVTLAPGASLPAPRRAAASGAAHGWGRRTAAVAAVIVLAAGGLAFWLGSSSLQNDAARTAPAATGGPAGPSIVVLPFDNLSSDPEQEYFADGITEDITTHLSKIGKLFVISRNTAFSYKGKQFRAKQVAGDLGVSHLLEGSVRRAGNQVRINAQLIDGATGSHVWAEIYDGALDDIFAVQDEITAKIVEALKIRLTESEAQRAGGPETGSLEAYDAYLEGWNFYSKNTSEDLPRARDLFEKALAFDPGYTRAHAALAAVYYKATTEGWFTLRLDDWAQKQRLEQHLERAMDKPNALALIVTARIEIWKGQHRSAMSYVERAIELEPSNAEAYTVLGKALLFAGRHAEALEKLGFSMQLDPGNIAEPLDLSGLAQFLSGDIQGAIRLLERSRTLHPERSSAGAEVTLAAAYALAGREDDARRASRTVIELWEDFYWTEPRIAEIMTHFPFDRAQDARRLAENLLAAGICCEQDVDNVARSGGQ